MLRDGWFMGRRQKATISVGGLGVRFRLPVLPVVGSWSGTISNLPSNSVAVAISKFKLRHWHLLLYSTFFDGK